MKQKLLLELSVPLRARVACLVNLHCSAGLEGLRFAAMRRAEVLERSTQCAEQCVVSRFLELARAGEAQQSSVCYGVSQTAAAIRLGAVDRVLVAKQLCTHRDWQALAAAYGSTIVEIEPKSEAEVRFCEGFQVGAVLRYAVAPELLEEPPSEDETPNASADEGPQKSPSPAAPGADVEAETASTATPRSNARLLEWLEDALLQSLGDGSAAEALTMCVDVLLFDGSAKVSEESLNSVLEMLRGEEVSEEVLMELTCHVADLVDESLRARGVSG